MANTAPQTVYVVDDNPELRRSLCDYLRATGLEVEGFSSAEDFLKSYRAESGGCLVLDIQMPQMSGLDLQEYLVTHQVKIPVIIISGQAAVKDAVRAMKLGSFEFLEKPIEPSVLATRVREALKADLEQRAESDEKSKTRELFSKLTPRERHILFLVVSGKPSKEIAGILKLSVSTVDNHRANIMKKLKANTSADLTRITLMIDPRLAFPKGV